MVMLTDFGLSKIKSTERKIQHKNTRNIILNGIDWDSIRKNCYQIDVYDNMGHRRRCQLNGKVGYCQTTQRATITFTTVEATCLGLYWDPIGPDDQDILRCDDMKWSTIAINTRDSTSTSDKIVDVFDECVHPQQQCENNLGIQ
mmetsp:Transcript_49739/g.50570  ORF Transcript_49739/g.50570 Transcript_49739/m.50570 type:complete len:144 (-) Transcript_49739:227-658(-)